ncbi:MAG: TIGR01777 family protein [Chloroflexi bacterium]|nr:TIGR01777 family protein [Chloroflexota bacterium]
MQVAITGCSGLIGTALRQQLEAAGHTVTPVRRGPPTDPAAHWDPASGWFREGALDGIDAVVHLAGASIGEGRWSAARKQEIRASRVEATALLVRHLGTLANRPRVLVTASGTGFYGNRGDEPLTEDSTGGSGFLADLVRDWEAEAARAGDLGLRVVLARTGVVLAKEGGALPKMILPFRFGAGGRIGNGRQWLSWISLPDVTGVLADLLARDIAGPVNVVAPNPVTNRQLTSALAKVLRRPAVFPVPGFALKLLIGESAEELLLQGQRVLPARLEAAGYQFQQPDLASALTATLKGGQR